MIWGVNADDTTRVLYKLAVVGVKVVVMKHYDSMACFMTDIHSTTKQRVQFLEEIFAALFPVTKRYAMDHFYASDLETVRGSS
jgi:hypothetical protein